MTLHWNHAKLHELMSSEMKPDETEMALSEITVSLYKVTQTWRGQSGSNQATGIWRLLQGLVVKWNCLVSAKPLKDSQKNCRRTWKPRNTFCLLFATSEFSECHFPYLMGSLRRSLFDSPFCPLFEDSHWAVLHRTVMHICLIFYLRQQAPGCC